MSGKHAFTYDELFGEDEPTGLLEYAKEGQLDDATYERLEHLGRFCERVCTSGNGKEYLPIGLVLSEADLRRLWLETGGQDDEYPSRPFLEIFSKPAVPWLARFI